MKIKLCFIINSLRGGGAERVISNLGNHFHKRGFDVTMICLNTCERVYALHEGIKVIELVKRTADDTLLKRAKYLILTFVRLVRALKSEKPKMLISFMATSNLLGGIACRILGVPYIVSERTAPDYTVNRYGPLLKWLSFNIYSNSKAIVVPARGMIGSFEKNEDYKRLRNFRVVRNPINVFAPPTTAHVHHRKFVFAAGGLRRVKGFDLLIQAFSELKNHEYDLLISGRGPEEESLNQLIRQLHLQDRVHLIGFKGNLQDYYRQAELFVLSSRNEGYPNVLVEAMSMGCPSIAVDCQFGPAEIIRNGINGLLVEPGNIAELTAAMDLVLADPVLRARLAHNAREINHTNSLETISSDWEKLILSHV